MKKALLVSLFSIILIVFALFSSSCSDNDGKPDITGPADTDSAAGATETPSTEDTAKDITETAPPAETEAPEEEIESLCGYYADDFYIGVALPDGVLSSWKKYKDIILENFNSFTCENEMKPDYMLDQSATRANLEANYLSPVVKFTSAAKILKRASENGIKMRLHTLVWHAQTPDWLFTEDYTATGTLVSRETMLARMENYIKQVLSYYAENYPGLIYAVDVVNEAIDQGNGDKDGVRKVDNKWYDTIGADYIYWAFYYARQYAPDDMKLFYNDYSCMYKPDLILKNLKRISEEGLIDGIGMQSHLDVNAPIKQFLSTAERFAKAGYEVQLTELDIGVSSPTEAMFRVQRRVYTTLMSGLQKLRADGCNITSVTLWGLSDKLTWRSGDYPLLLNEDLSKKPAYYGFLQSSK